MKHLTPRPSTPPPCTGLLTPPSTGGFGKHELFAVPQELRCSSRRQSQANNRGETLIEAFQEYDEGPDVQADHKSITSPFPAGDSSASSEGECSTGGCATSVTSIPYDAATPDNDGVQTAFTPTLIAVSPSEPFPLLKLPLSVRNKVYEYLLVVPAIICVRQKHTAFHDEKKAFLYAEHRYLLPGIAYALAQIKVGGFKTRFSRFAGVNLNILRTSKDVFAEARAAMYSKNDFEIVRPSNEQTPEPNYSIPLFPSGYQRLVTKLIIRIRTFYDLNWILSGGYNAVKNYYRGLDTLTLILDMDSATKGLGRQWSRKEYENRVTYIKRLQDEIAEDLFDGAGSKDKSIPTCLNLRVLFNGECYMGGSGALTDIVGIAMTDNMQTERTKREELRSALVETWELFKKGAS